MNTNITPAGFNLKDDEKLSAVMVYTAYHIYWGDVLMKKQFRTGTWLQTSAIPDYLALTNNKTISTFPGSSLKPISFTEVHIPISQVLIFHVTPPDEDPIKFDPSEPNMQTLNAILQIGNYEIDGKIRISSKINPTQYLQITHEAFYSVYDSIIHCPTMPEMGAFKVPFTIARIQESVLSIK